MNRWLKFIAPAIATALLGLISWASSSIIGNREAIAVQKARVENIDGRLEKIDNRLDRIENKLDRVIERKIK